MAAPQLLTDIALRFVRSDALSIYDVQEQERRISTGGRIVPNSLFFDLCTWHLIHQAYTRKSLHFAKELWTDFADQSLRQSLMGALEQQHGHRMLSRVEAAKIACSITGEDAPVDLDFLSHDPGEPLGVMVTATAMADALQQSLSQVVQCARDCVHTAACLR